MRYLPLYFIVLFASCGSPYQVDEDIKLFRYNESAGIRSLDPAFAKDQANIWGVNQIYNGLVQLDDSLKVQPCIAESWEITDSNTLYIFHLRNDVFFHESPAFKNGTRTVTSHDIQYSLQRLVDEKTASPGRWVMENVGRNPDESLNINCPDDLTVQIRLKAPFSPFLSLLSMQYCSVVPQEAIEYYGEDFGRNPVGTGPFRFQYWKENVKLVLLKNENYFEKDESGNALPYLDGVVVTFIAEKHTAFMEFMQGNFDMISGLDPNYKDVLLNADGSLKEKHNSFMYMTRIPYLNTEYLGILIDPEAEGSLDVLQKQNIRLAMNYGFDRVKMMRYLRNNIGYPGLYGMIPPGLSGYHEDSATAFYCNPEKARQLLAEAGFPNGAGLPDITLQTTASYLDLCEYIQKELSAFGFKITLDVIPPATLREMVSQSKSPFFRASWIADYPDAENYLSLFYSPYTVPNGPNYTHFNNPEYDKLYRQSISTENDSVRQELYADMNAMIMAEAPVMVLYYDMAVRFINNRITGLKPNAMNLLNLKEVRKD
ncbi:MAG: ABC transporter substrate-binding protein [Marinilabiliales bacterium]|nr:MAG: ABC transporter substrate-binding protein [Marinilabiliales bacterium]